MEQAKDPKLQIHKSGQDDITYLQFVGTIDENFDGEGLAKGLDGHLVMSLAQVRRITSFGIRNWIAFVTKISESCRSIYFIECAPRIVDQFNMVANFGGRGHIVSFYAPFRCEYCGAERLNLFVVERDWDMIREMRLEGGECPNDKNQEYFDEDPESYLSYIVAQPRFEMDPGVAAFMARRTGTAVPDTMRRVRIDKKISGRRTFISISGDIGGDFPIQKLAEGLEGDVVFDMTKVGRVTEEGLGQWRALLQTIAPTTEKIIVIRLPSIMLEQLSRDRDLAQKGQVLSLYLPYGCASCGITAQLEVDVHESYDHIRTSTPPEMACQNCGKQANPKATREMLAGLAELPPPADDLKVEKLLEELRKLEAPAAPTGPVGFPGPMPGMAPAAYRRWPLLVGLGGVTVLVLAIAIYLGLQKGTIGGGGPGTIISGQFKVVEKSSPKAPKWQNEKFASDGNQVLVTGASTEVEDKQEGFTRAKAAALEELCHQVALLVQDPVWIQHVGSQYQDIRAKAMEEYEKALVSGDIEAIRPAKRHVLAKQDAVAEAFKIGTTSIAQPMQVETYWEKLQTEMGTRYRVWSRYQLARKEVDRLIKHYTTRREALSAYSVPLFPAMAWRYEHLQGAVIVGMKPESPLKRIGVLPGDILISAQDRNIKDAAAFKRVLNEEHSQLRASGGTMALRFQRKDAPISEFRLTVARRAVRPAPVRRYVPRRPTYEQPTRRLPPANIWDDNPFE